jgi:hypothetical protein
MGAGRFFGGGGGSRNAGFCLANPLSPREGGARLAVQFDGDPSPLLPESRPLSHGRARKAS